LANNLMQEIQDSFTTLGNAFQNHPFDFFRENDVTCFLYNELKLRFSNRVPVVLAQGIEPFKAFEDSNRMTCTRVHTELKIQGGTDCFDLVVLQDREQQIYPKSQKMAGGFKPPFLIGIEVKIGYGSRSSRLSGGKVLEDIAKLATCRDSFAHAYVVFVDFYEGRKLTKLKEDLRILNRVGLFYAGLDRFEMIMP
jgi:hypothetical protein